MVGGGVEVDGTFGTGGLNGDCTGSVAGDMVGGDTKGPGKIDRGAPGRNGIIDGGLFTPLVGTGAGEIILDPGLSGWMFGGNCGKR